MASFDSVVLYIILGALIGVIWALRRIYVLEGRIMELDKKTSTILGHITSRKKK